MSFHRLVRFVDEHEDVQYGEASMLPWNDSLEGQNVPLYRGGDPWEQTFSLSAEEATICRVLSPIPDTPIIYGVGLNYKQHAKEANLSTPNHPLIFTKPPDALNGPFDDVPFVRDAKSLDYEGELSLVIGKDCKDIPDSEDPLAYVLGYTVGNDISARFWQQPAQCGQQHGYAKSFDGFAPIGPTLCSPTAISDINKLVLVTRVNGEERQRVGIDDQIFTISAIIRHLSRGRKLRQGTVIMTGTPSGVGLFQNPPQFLKSNDSVQVEISEIGIIENKMVENN